MIEQMNKTVGSGSDPDQVIPEMIC